MTYRIEHHDLDSQGSKPCHVYDLEPRTDRGRPDYWEAVTDVPCPIDSCEGMIRWAEAGYVPGYRICDKCGRHFLAKGTAAEPTLVRVVKRRSKV